MDRRDFFKRVFSASLFAPLLMTSREKQPAGELYILSNFPHKYISPIFDRLRNLGADEGARFAFIGTPLNADALKKEIARLGISPAARPDLADILIASTVLQKANPPSFTFIRGGQVMDLRTGHLFPLWEKMSRSESPSSCLTRVSFNTRGHRVPPGSFAAIYIGGERRDLLSLKKSLVKSYRAGNGKVVVQVSAGRVWIEDSSCRQKICLSTKPVSRIGERIICAPNHFLLEVGGSRFLDTVIG